MVGCWEVEEVGEEGLDLGEEEGRREEVEVEVEVREGEVCWLGGFMRGSLVGALLGVGWED